MTCPHCGAPQIPGNRFCHRCRKRVAASPPAPRRAPAPPREGGGQANLPTGHGPAGFTRPALVTLLAALNVLGGVFAIGVSLTTAIVLLSSEKASQGNAVMVALLAVFAVLGGVQIATGVGLFRLQPWGRTLQIVLAGLGLLGIPCGTLISILILVYMLKPEVKTLFSGIPPRRLPPEEVTRVESLAHATGSTMIIVGVVVLAFAAIPFAGIVAAIAIPSFLRARVSANESMAIGQLRTVVSAQQAYASANMGFADELECLAEPTMCLPGYPSSAPAFLDSSLLAEQRGGYEFWFMPGPLAPEEAHQSGPISETSLTGWALIAVPLQQGQTGVRSFCADAYGTLCFTPDGTVPDAEGAECPVSDDGGQDDCWPVR